MNEQRIEQIKNQIRELMREITSMGEEPPEFIQDLLMQVIEKAQNQIQELRQQNEPPGQPPSGQPPISPTAPSSDAELLWVLAGQDPQAFISYLRTFPTPATQNLLLNPELLNATIERLQTLLPQGEPPIADGIPHAPLNSSNVWGAAYDQRSGKMRVRFNSGSVYEYDNVPLNIFRAFISGNAAARTDGQNRFGRWWKNKTPSIGAAMHQYIRRGNFPYRRLN